MLSIITLLWYWYTTKVFKNRWIIILQFILDIWPLHAYNLIPNNMKTLTSSLEQQSRSLHTLTTSIEHPHTFTSTSLSSPSTPDPIPTSTQSYFASSDIRPATPEITYPYSLYKSEEDYKRKLALMMKPNQVSLPRRIQANVSFTSTDYCFRVLIKYLCHSKH